MNDAAAMLTVQANGVLKKYREMGQRGGMCVISDRVFSHCIDPDHPLGRKEAGVLGWPGCSLLEFEELMEGIPLTGQSITLLGSSAPTVMRPPSGRAMKRSLSAPSDQKGALGA